MDDLLPCCEGNTPKSVKYCGWMLLLFMVFDIGFNFIFEFLLGFLYLPVSAFNIIFIIFTNMLIFFSVVVASHTLLHSAAFSCCISQLYCNLNDKLSNSLSTTFGNDTNKFEEERVKPQVSCLTIAFLIVR